MTNSQLLLQQIAADPKCDTLRLAYADALEEENADPTDRHRAYFIRGSIKYHSHGYWWEMHPHWHHTGFTALPPNLDGEFSRGFCVRLRCTLGEFEREAPLLFTREPVIAEVTLVDCLPWVGQDDAPLYGWSPRPGGHRQHDDLPLPRLARLPATPPR